MNYAAIGAIVFGGYMLYVVTNVGKPIPNGMQEIKVIEWAIIGGLIGFVGGWGR